MVRAMVLRATSRGLDPRKGLEQAVLAKTIFEPIYIMQIVLTTDISHRIAFQFRCLGSCAGLFFVVDNDCQKRNLSGTDRKHIAMPKRKT